MNSYLDKIGLENILKKIKNNFVNNNELDTYIGIIKRGDINNGIISTDNQSTNNCIYKITSTITNNTCNITVNNTDALDLKTPIKTYYYNTSVNKYIFNFPENYYINYPTKLFEFKIEGGNKILKSYNNLQYFIITITLIENNVKLIDIQCGEDGISEYYISGWFDCSTGEKFLNYDWYKLNNEYITGIYISYDITGTSEFEQLVFDEYNINENTFINNNEKTIYSVKVYLKNGLLSARDMFNGCSILEIYLNNKPDTIIDFSYMCANSKCSSPYTGDKDNYISMPNNVNCTGMFMNCTEMKFICSSSTKDSVRKKLGDRDNWYYGKLFFKWEGNANWTSMFEGCSNLYFVDLDDWIVKSGSKINADRMFYGCFCNDEWTGAYYNTGRFVLNPGVVRLPYPKIEEENTGTNRPKGKHDDGYIISWDRMFSHCKWLTHIFTRHTNNDREFSNKAITIRDSDTTIEDLDNDKNVNMSYYKINPYNLVYSSRHYYYAYYIIRNFYNDIFIKDKDFYKKYDLLGYNNYIINNDEFNLNNFETDEGLMPEFSGASNTPLNKYYKHFDNIVNEYKDNFDYIINHVRKFNFKFAGYGLYDIIKDKNVRPTTISYGIHENTEWDSDSDNKKWEDLNGIEYYNRGNSLLGFYINGAYGLNSDENEFDNIASDNVNGWTKYFYNCYKNMELLLTSENINNLYLQYIPTFIQVAFWSFISYFGEKCTSYKLQPYTTTPNITAGTVLYKLKGNYDFKNNGNYDSNNFKPAGFDSDPAETDTYRYVDSAFFPHQSRLLKRTENIFFENNEYELIE